MAGLLSGVASQRHAAHRCDHPVQVLFLDVLFHSSSFLLFDETNVSGGPRNVQLSMDYVLYCGLGVFPNFAVALFSLKQVDIDASCTEAPVTLDGGRGEMAMAMALGRRLGFRWWAVHQVLSLSFTLRDVPSPGREARRGPISFPARYVVCCRVFDISGPDGSRDQAVARMRVQLLDSWNRSAMRTRRRRWQEVGSLMPVRESSLAKARDERVPPPRSALGTFPKTDLGGTFQLAVHLRRGHGPAQ